MNIIPKPILKWVGGKTQILENILYKFPNEINNYHEIFLGGGSVLLGLLTQIKNNKIKVNGTINAYDINEPLIYIYKNIQDNYEELYDELQKIINEYNTCNNNIVNRKPKTISDALNNKENYYYWIRNIFNKLCCKTNIYASALFIFLNKTCFRGIYREGPRGFNVPYGHYNNPEIINKHHLYEIHILIKNVNFICCDYSISLSKCSINDFIYLDPPYAPGQ